MPGIDYQAVREAVSLGQVLELIGFEPSERRGPQLRGPCPVHNSTSPKSRSFSAHLGKHTFHCFGCGASGNQLDLWSSATGLTLHEATLDLCQRLGLAVPYIASPPRQTNRTPAKEPEKRNP